VIERKERDAKYERQKETKRGKEREREKKRVRERDTCVDQSRVYKTTEIYVYTFRMLARVRTTGVSRSRSWQIQLFETRPQAFTVSFKPIYLYCAAGRGRGRENKKRQRIKGDGSWRDKSWDRSAQGCAVCSISLSFSLPFFPAWRKHSLTTIRSFFLVGIFNLVLSLSLCFTFFLSPFFSFSIQSHSSWRA